MTASERIRAAREANSANTAEVRKTAQALTAAQSTPQIVEAFTLTDKLLTQSGITPGQYLAICETRGWMIDELATRNELALIGLDD